MNHVRTIVLAVTAMIGVAIIAVVTAQDGSTANVEVRVWQSTSDAESLYISARPEGGSWATLGTIPLDMSGLNSRGTFRYGDITVAVPVPAAAAIDDSPPCLELAEAIAGISGVDLTTCSGTFREGYESIDDWAVAGNLVDHGEVHRYSGSAYQIEDYGVVISWESDSPCSSFRKWVEKDYDASTFSQCRTTARLYTNTGHPYYNGLSWELEGRLWIQGHENKYLVESEVTDGFVPQTFKLYEYDLAYSASR